MNSYVFYVMQKACVVMRAETAPQDTLLCCFVVSRALHISPRTCLIRLLRARRLCPDGDHS